MRAVLLSAGFGSRLGAVTADTPKPMLELGGSPILESNIELVRAVGIEDAVVNLHHRPDRIMSYFGDGSRFGVRIHWSPERRLRGTAGALDQARELLSGHQLVVVYADNRFVGSLAPVLAAHAGSRALATIARWWRADVRQSGELLLDDGGRVLKIREKFAGTGPRGGWVNAGIIVAEPGLLDLVPRDRDSDLTADVLPNALAAGARVMSVAFPGELFWVDTPADLERARRRFRTAAPPK
jgi:NDP-sugar pyrophosphorylase family protein